MAQTTCLALSGQLVSVFFIISCSFLILTTVIYSFSNGPKRRCNRFLGPRARDTSESQAPVLCITHSQHDNTTMSSPHHATTTTPKTPTGAEQL